MRAYSDQPSIPGTFGVEIEFDCDGGFRAVTEIIKALREAGLTNATSQRIRHLGSRPEGMWIVENDGSASGEVVSPVLTDTPEAREQIAKVCEILRDHGARVTWRNGGHTHSGARELDIADNSAAQRRLVKLNKFAEDILYRVAANSGPDHLLHRGAYTKYVASPPLPAHVPIANTPPTIGDIVGTFLRRIAARPRYGLNLIALEPTKKRGATVEWRYWDPSLDPSRWIFNAGLGSRMVDAAVRLEDGDIPDTHHPVGEAMNATNQDVSYEAAERFAELVYPDAADREAFHDVFGRSDWQPAKNAKEPLSEAWTRDPARERALLPNHSILRTVPVAAALAAGAAALWLPMPGDAIANPHVSWFSGLASAVLAGTASTAALGILPWKMRFGRVTRHTTRLAVIGCAAIASAAVLAIPGIAPLNTAANVLAEGGVAASAVITAGAAAVGYGGMIGRRIRLATHPVRRLA